jgi:hypothetical protein
MGRHHKPLEGQTFGRLTVIAKAETATNGDILWLCRCACSDERKISGCDLRAGKTRSCGCLKTRKERNLGWAVIPRIQYPRVPLDS